MILLLPNILSTHLFSPMQFAVLIARCAPQDSSIDGRQCSGEWLPFPEIQRTPGANVCAMEPIELSASCRKKIVKDGVDIVEVRRWAMMVGVLLNQLVSSKMAS